MPLTFIADVHISPLTVSELRKSGLQVQRITEFLSATATDEEIIEYAKSNNAVIITQDLDFSALVAQSGELKPSVISLRVQNAKPTVISKLLQSTLPRLSKELIDGAIVSIDEQKFRIRKLPVRTS